MNTKVSDEINQCFIERFSMAYKAVNPDNKEIILKYSSAFFRKWIYSALINDTLITPSAIVQNYTQNNIYPVFSNGSVKRIGSMTVRNIQFSIDDHPICRDFKLLLKAFGRGISLDSNMDMSFEDIKSIKGLSACDSEYVSYLTSLGIEMGYIKKMPSINTVVYTTTALADSLESVENKYILDELVDGAFYYAVKNIYPLVNNCDRNELSSLVRKYVISPVTTDELYEKIFKEKVKGEHELLDGFTDFSDTTIVFARGIILDKALLAPFAYYFKFLNLHYMYEYSFEDEIHYLDGAYNILTDGFMVDGSDDEEESINNTVSSIIYSPPTLYVTTSLGNEYFGSEKVNADNSPENVLSTLTAEEVLNAALYDCDDTTYDKIVDAYTPVLEFCDIIITDENSLSYKLSVCSSMLLSELNDTLFIINYNGLLYKEYRFYKLPENVFTEYKPRKAGEAGLSSDDTTVGDVLKTEGEILCYEAVALSEEFKPLQKRKLTILLDKKYKEKRKADIYFEAVN